MISDSSIFYFVIMVRHGAHVIFTQMVSTHEAMVRGSLDFPNLISLNNVTQDFIVDVEIYGMVSRLCCHDVTDAVTRPSSSPFIYIMST